MIAAGDLIQYKVYAGPRYAWHAGYVAAIEPDRYQVEPAAGGALIWVPKRRGREVHGARLDELRQTIHFPQSPEPIRVRVSGPVTLDTPGEPWRCDEYRAEVRRGSCGNLLCPTPAEPVDAHPAGALGIGGPGDASCFPACAACYQSFVRMERFPGLSRSATIDRIAELQQQSLGRWLCRQERQIARVPLLARVAALLLALLLPCLAWAIEPVPCVDPTPEDLAEGLAALRRDDYLSAYGLCLAALRRLGGGVLINPATCDTADHAAQLCVRPELRLRVCASICVGMAGVKLRSMPDDPTPPAAERPPPRRGPRWPDCLAAGFAGLIAVGGALLVRRARVKVRR